MNKNTTSLHGKTIKSIRKGAINCWNINFTDGISVSIWAEIDGPLNLGQLWLDQKQSFRKVKI